MFKNGQGRSLRLCVWSFHSDYHLDSLVIVLMVLLSLECPR